MKACSAWPSTIQYTSLMCRLSIENPLLPELSEAVLLKHLGLGQCLLEAEEALAKAAVVTIINDLNAMGHTNVDLERIMRLPARTLARWRNDPSIMPSSAALTLLKIVRTFPWLLEVMDCSYDREKAKSIHLAHAVEELVEITGRFKAVDEKWAQKDLNLRPTEYESAP